MLAHDKLYATRPNWAEGRSNYSMEICKHGVSGRRGRLASMHTSTLMAKTHGCGWRWWRGNCAQATRITGCATPLCWANYGGLFAWDGACPDSISFLYSCCSQSQHALGDNKQGQNINRCNINAHIPTYTKFPVHPTCVSLDCGRKPEHKEQTHIDTGWTRKHRTAMPELARSGLRPWLWGNSEPLCHLLTQIIHRKCTQ